VPLSGAHSRAFFYDSILKFFVGGLGNELQASITEFQYIGVLRDKESYRTAGHKNATKTDTNFQSVFEGKASTLTENFARRVGDGGAAVAGAQEKICMDGQHARTRRWVPLRNCCHNRYISPPAFVFKCLECSTWRSPCGMIVRPSMEYV
jgi:hypothetical protein